jgi:hypothetical protein
MNPSIQTAFKPIPLIPPLSEEPLTAAPPPSVMEINLAQLIQEAVDPTFKAELEGQLNELRTNRMRQAARRRPSSPDLFLQFKLKLNIKDYPEAIRIASSLEGECRERAAKLLFDQASEDNNQPVLLQVLALFSEEEKKEQSQRVVQEPMYTLPEIDEEGELYCVAPVLAPLSRKVKPLAEGLPEVPLRARRQGMIEQGDKENLRAAKEKLLSLPETEGVLEPLKKINFAQVTEAAEGHWAVPAEGTAHFMTPQSAAAKIRELIFSHELDWPVQKLLEEIQTCLPFLPEQWDDSRLLKAHVRQIHKLVEEGFECLSATSLPQSEREALATARLLYTEGGFSNYRLAYDTIEKLTDSSPKHFLIILIYASALIESCEPETRRKPSPVDYEPPVEELDPDTIRELINVCSATGDDETVRELQIRLNAVERKKRKCVVYQGEQRTVPPALEIFNQALVKGHLQEAQKIAENFKGETQIWALQKLVKSYCDASNKEGALSILHLIPEGPAKEAAKGLLSQTPEAKVTRDDFRAFFDMGQSLPPPLPAREYSDRFRDFSEYFEKTPEEAIDWAVNQAEGNKREKALAFLSAHFLQNDLFKALDFALLMRNYPIRNLKLIAIFRKHLEKQGSIQFALDVLGHIDQGWKNDLQYSNLVFLAEHFATVRRDYGKAKSLLEFTKEKPVYEDLLLAKLGAVALSVYEDWKEALDLTSGMRSPREKNNSFKLICEFLIKQIDLVDYKKVFEEAPLLSDLGIDPEKALEAKIKEHQKMRLHFFLNYIEKIAVCDIQDNSISNMYFFKMYSICTKHKELERAEYILLNLIPSDVRVLYGNVLSRHYEQQGKPDKAAQLLEKLANCKK